MGYLYVLYSYNYNMYLLQTPAELFIPQLVKKSIDLVKIYCCRAEDLLLLLCELSKFLEHHAVLFKVCSALNFANKKKLSPASRH